MQKNGSGMRLIKPYREGNIVSAFGTDLMLGAGVFVPSLLLRYYKKLGVSDTGMILLIQLFRLRTEEGRFYTSPSELAEWMAADEEVVARELRALLDKEILAVTEYYDGEQVIEGFDFQPLFEKLSEVWACAKVAEIQEIQELLQEGQRPALKTPECGATDEVFSELYQAFEKEFGRPLSPIEAEQVLKWRRETSPALVLEALRRAVLLGKHNFKYIGTILLEWQKNNLRTLAEVEEYDRNFEASRKRRRKAPRLNNREEIERKEKKKELIRRLYS